MGLQEMREISLRVSPDDLREIANFLRHSADELEQTESLNWHKHFPESLQCSVGCDVVVVRNQ